MMNRTISGSRSGKNPNYMCYVAFRLAPADLEQVTTFAHARRQSVSAVVRGALVDGGIIKSPLAKQASNDGKENNG